MVLRPLLLRAALGAVTTLAAVLLTGPAASAAGPGLAQDPEDYAVPASYDAPLLITIDKLTPGEIPGRGAGPVTVSGKVINRDVETWTGIRIYPFINSGTDCQGCPPPITTAADLVEAAETEPDALVGNRITDVSGSIDELAPGEEASYSITIPRRLLQVVIPGVYWFGVHALGASEGKPDDLVADGRARTFLPYIPRGRDGVRGKIKTAVVVPLRHRIRHLSNGRIAGTKEWETAFGATGELGAPLEFGAAATGRPVTWLIDPAVPDAARLLRRGNPPRDLGPDETDNEDGGESPKDGASSGGADGTEPPETDRFAVAAGDWLDSLEVQVRGEEVLALPYGDLDMSATPDRMPELYPLARDRVGDVMTSWDTPTTPVVASPGGYLDPSAIESIDDDSTLLLTDRMFGRADYRHGPPPVGVYADHRIAVTSSAVATGGPGPEPRLGAVAFRQRVLAEAALRLLRPGRRHPLIVVMPRDVDGATGATFWSEMDADWLNLTTVADATDQTPTTIDPETLVYSDEQETEELTSTVFSEAAELIEAGATLQNLLATAGPLAADVNAEALSALSYDVRADADAAVSRLTRSRHWIERRLRSVGINGPPGVTLSSADGSFAVTVTNDLDRPVTVQVAAESVDDEVQVDVGDPVVLGAESRTTILVDAHTRGTGVHNVTLSVTDVAGTPLGSSVEVPIRSGQVSEVIWVILGTGGGILFVAIALRLFRRIRGRGVSTGSTTEGSTTEGSTTEGAA